jgi:hypothetical protein
MATIKLSDTEEAIHKFMREITLYFDYKGQDVKNERERVTRSNLELARCDYLSALKKEAK